MVKNNKNWGGEYAAPALEVLDVNVENGFAASNPWDNALNEDTNWDSATDEFE